MKKIILCVFLISSTLAYGQNISLTFMAFHGSTAIPLDSILIKNITQAVDTTIYFPENSIEFVLNTTTNNYSQNNLTVLPNPSNSNSILTFTIQKPGLYKIIITDKTGRVIIKKIESYSVGEHNFNLHLSKGFYLVNLFSEYSNETIKVISYSENLNSTLTEIGNYNFKTIKSSMFDCTIGDELEYIGFITNDGVIADTIHDNFSESTIYEFQFDYFECGEMLSYEGHDYKTVQIGTQCWFAENLQYLPYVHCCLMTYPENYNPECYVYNYYDYDNLYYDFGPWNPELAIIDQAENYETYGVLYNIHSAMILCPSGWHLPSDSEWMTLETEIGLHVLELEKWQLRGDSTNTGGKLKSLETWNSPNIGATNSINFDALASGYMWNNGRFEYINEQTIFWTSTIYENSNPDDDPRHIIRRLYYNYAGIGRDHWYDQNGFSVRCIKD